MSESEFTESYRDDDVTIPREEYEYLKRFEDRFDELAERVTQLEARRRRDDDVTVEFRNEDDDTQFIEDLFVGRVPLGKRIENIGERADETAELVADLKRDDHVTGAEADSLLPIQRLARTATADPDQLTANKRRAGLVWDSVSTIWKSRAEVWIFDSDHVASFLAGRDEQNDRRTVGRVIDIIVDGGEDVVSRDTGPSGRTLVKVDKNGFRDQIDSIAKRSDDSEGSSK